MAGTTVDIENIISPDNLGTEIAERWRTWNMARQTKIEEWKELRNYVYATDTRTTSNSKLPWTTCNIPLHLLKNRLPKHHGYIKIFSIPNKVR